MLVGTRLVSGIRALYELSLLSERRSTVRDLARKCGVREPFLRRVLLDLRARGYLEAQKGRFGGFRLVKSPQEIKIADLAKALEKQPTLAFGRARQDLLALDPTCSTYPFWANIEDKFLQELENLTLADVIAVAKVPTKRARTRRAKRPRPAPKRKSTRKAKKSRS